MQTTTRTFVVDAIAADVVISLLQRDDAGRPPRVLTQAEGGTPLRCCLRRSRPGERVALVSYAPLHRWALQRRVDPGAYDETGPVFIHAESCAGPSDDGFPAALRDSPRMFRAYSADGRIVTAVPVEAHGAFETTIDTLFADPDVAVVHARAVDFGCFTFAVRRASAG